MAHLSIPDPAAIDRGGAVLLRALRPGRPLSDDQRAALAAIVEAGQSARAALPGPDHADPYPRAAGVAWSLVDTITRQLAGLGAGDVVGGLALDDVSLVDVADASPPGAGDTSRTAAVDADETGPAELVEVCGVCRARGGRLVLSHDGPDGYPVHPACLAVDEEPAAADVRPLEVEPVSVHAPHDVRRPAPGDLPPAGALFAEHEAVLLAALAGVELGAYDRRMVTWLSRWDQPTVATVVSLLGRVRAAGGVR